MLTSLLLTSVSEHCSHHMVGNKGEELVLWENTNSINTLK